MCVCGCVCFFFVPSSLSPLLSLFRSSGPALLLMMERIRKEMILMERGLHSPVSAGKRLADAPGNSVLEALEKSAHVENTIE